MRNKSKHINHIEYKYLPEFVYGSIDGIITTFAIIAGVVGASLSSSIILILGFANLVADGFSMAASNYLSTKSRNEISNQRKNALKTASATYLSFLFLGFIPLLPFVLASITKNNLLTNNQFTFSFILTGLALLIVGGIKGKITEKNIFKSSLQTFLIGGIAAIIAFSIGYLVKTII